MGWRNFFGYTINVFNQATDSNGDGNGEGQLCAYQTDPKDPAKLGVSPCFLPKFVSGPYWVIAYNEEEGYALISGGQPTIRTENGCKTGYLGDRSYNGGLWIFTRQYERDEALVQKVRDIAKAQGFDVAVGKGFGSLLQLHQTCTNTLFRLWLSCQLIMTFILLRLRTEVFQSGVFDPLTLLV